MWPNPECGSEPDVWGVSFCLSRLLSRNTQHCVPRVVCSDPGIEEWTAHGGMQGRRKRSPVDVKDPPPPSSKGAVACVCRALGTLAGSVGRVKSGPDGARMRHKLNRCLCPDVRRSRPGSDTGTQLSWPSSRVPESPLGTGTSSYTARGWPLPQEDVETASPKLLPGTLQNQHLCLFRHPRW